MKWIEVVVLRTSENIPVKQISQLIKQSRLNDELHQPQEIKTFRNTDIETDLCIHIIWDTDEVFSGESPVKHRLTRMLKPYGLVCQSSWIEDGLN